MAKRGYDAKLFVGTDPDDEEVANARDVNLEGTAGSIDVSSRSGAGWKEKLAGMRDWKVSNQQIWVADDAAFELLETAWLEGSEIFVLMLDAEVETGFGYSGNAIVTKLGRAEPLEGGLTCDIELEGTGELTKVEPD